LTEFSQTFGNNFPDIFDGNSNNPEYSPIAWKSKGKKFFVVFILDEHMNTDKKIMTWRGEHDSRNVAEI
jgi:hypothetical protein